jgi:hypothetical protein
MRRPTTVWPVGRWCSFGGAGPVSAAPQPIYREPADLEKKTDRYTRQTERYADMRSLSGVVSEWCTDQFSYPTGLVTP